MTNIRLQTITAFTLLALSLPVRADEQPKPPDKSPAISHAITALSREFKSNNLREKSDYFGKTPPPEVTPEAIVQALERPVPVGPRAEAYIKWQLLSAIPAKFPDDLVQRVLAVYRRAPYPAEHPGLNRRDLERAVMGIQKDQMPAANKEFAAVIHKLNQANEPILDYRQGLFERLPPGFDTFAAGLTDLHVRISHGLKSDKFFDTVAAGIRSWSIGADRGQLSTIGNALYELKAALDQKNARPYKEIYEEKGVKWKTDQAIDPKKIDVLIEFMEQAANSPAGGLKFKDDKK